MNLQTEERYDQMSENRIHKRQTHSTLSRQYIPLTIGEYSSPGFPFDEKGTGDLNGVKELLAGEKPNCVLQKDESPPGVGMAPRALNGLFEMPPDVPRSDSSIVTLRGVGFIPWPMGGEHFSTEPAVLFVEDEIIPSSRLSEKETVTGGGILSSSVDSVGAFLLREDVNSARGLSADARDTAANDLAL